MFLQWNHKLLQYEHQIDQQSLAIFHLVNHCHTLNEFYVFVPQEFSVVPIDIDIFHQYTVIPEML